MTQASLSLLVSLVLGLVGGLALAPFDTPRIRGLLFASFSLPSLALVGVGMVYARHFEYGLGAIVFAHAYFNAPWIALSVIDAVSTFPRPWAEAARSLGGNRRALFFRLTLPWISPRVALAATQVFAFSVMSFTLVLLLGGGPTSGTLETEIYAQVRGSGLDIPGAAQFAVTQILLAALPLTLATLVRMPGADSVDLSVAHIPSVRGPRAGKSSKFTTILVFLWFLIPLLTLLAGNSPVGILRTLATLLRESEVRSAFLLTAGIATLSAAASLFLCLPFVSSNHRWIRSLGIFPSGVSPLVLCLGFFIAYATGRFAWIDPFEGSIFAMVLIHSVLLLPIGIRILLPVRIESEQPARKNLVLAARTLGATARIAWWRVESPIWKRAASDFFRIAWVWSFADLAVLSFFGSERLVTVPVLISRMMSRYEFQSASALLFLVAVLSSSVLIGGRGRA